MYVYLLKRTGRVYWDEMAGAVVIAGSEEEARLLASQEAWDEGPDAWLDFERSAIAFLGPATGETVPRIVLKDRRPG